MTRQVFRSLVYEHLNMQGLTFVPSSSVMPAKEAGCGIGPEVRFTQAAEN